MLPLTKRQREILDFLNDFIQQHGYAPSLEEVGKRFGLSSLATVHKHLTNLQAEAVRTYLVTKGVKFQQVVAQGYGSSVPLTPDTSPRGRAANRRVEIRPVAAAGP